MVIRHRTQKNQSDVGVFAPSISSLGSHWEAIGPLASCPDRRGTCARGDKVNLEAETRRSRLVDAWRGSGDGSRFHAGFLPGKGGGCRQGSDQIATWNSYYPPPYSRRPLKSDRLHSQRCVRQPQRCPRASPWARISCSAPWWWSRARRRTGGLLRGLLRSEANCSCAKYPQNRGGTGCVEKRPIVGSSCAHDWNHIDGTAGRAGARALLRRSGSAAAAAAAG
jgi:hypothetical protein